MEWNWLRALVVLIIIFVLVLPYTRAEARTFRTPSGVTCEMVIYWYHALGGMEGVREYGRLNNITLTARQYQQAAACLKMKR